MNIDKMKLAANWIRKISIGSALLALYQNSFWVIVIAIITLIISMYLEKRIDSQKS